MYSVIVDFQDDYGYSIIQSKDVTQQEVVFENDSFKECLKWYNVKRVEQDALDLEE